MRISIEEAQKTKLLFQNKGFIDGDGWNVSKWDKRQSGNCESYERVKRYRERQRNVTETLHGNNGNATETLPRARPDLLPNLHTSVTKEEPPNPLVRGKAPEAPFVPEPWVPRDDWDAWIAMRRSIRKPATRRAMELAQEKLLKLSRDGHHPATVLRQSVLNSWQGLFPVTQDRSETKPASQPSPELGLSPADLKAAQDAVARQSAEALVLARQNRERKTP